ncbi:histidine kinase [Chitinophaga horti]|uniref:Histidine kinase n=1 Tax=Chitinophaga horti TaxID=2920382 RepID=A0ABY6J9K4_9BACT|nr:histidine kinase [Chitinophaga horti]UYQ94976.1 histidine kinase [Chitinophaga horti]
MRKTAIILLHISYWCMYLLLICLFFLILPRANKQALSFSGLLSMMFLSPFVLMTIVPGVTAFYSYYFLLFNRFLLRKRFVPLAAGAIMFSLLSGAIPIIVMSLPVPWHFAGSIREKIIMAVIVAILGTIHGVIAIVMKGFISWYGDIKLKEDLQKKNYETELALVKSQINPHFLFNTINNIDVLIGLDADKASLYLNKLSDIMRFMLYETKSDLIPLSKELSYIDKYIELQKIRSSNAHYVTYEVAGEAGNTMISPMLFISYIENAFKHSEHRKSENAIDIHIWIEKENVRFTCTNKYSRQLPDRGEHNGLGNELLRKRLTLLYPDRHTLHIENSGGTYSVTLSLQTNGN